MLKEGPPKPMVGLCKAQRHTKCQGLAKEGNGEMVSINEAKGRHLI